MTEEQYRFLSNHRENLRLAAEAGYIMGVPTADARRVNEIYAAVIPGVNLAMCRNCTRDVRNRMKELWPYFLEYEKTLNTVNTVKTEKRSKKMTTDEWIESHIGQ
jgi:ribosomal protein S14